jgi:hypothetical protein
VQMSIVLRKVHVFLGCLAAYAAVSLALAWIIGPQRWLYYGVAILFVILSGILPARYGR